MTLKTKGFEGHTISMVQDQINEFLETIDEKNFVDMKLALAKREKTSPSEYYAAIIIYRR
jgi:hypothetical protein